MVGWDCKEKKRGSSQLCCLGIRDGGMRLYEKKKGSSQLYCLGIRDGGMRLNEIKRVHSFK